jgi:succinate dehydrogenase / fumarate reductase membrane anchor subunit
VWFLAGLISHLGGERADVAAWLARPFVSITFAALMFVTFIHAKMGLQVIIEDYVHTERRKHALVIFKDLCVYTLALTTIFAIVKLHFIGIK